ncbi:MAG: hypothetical protein MK085_09660 [Phycisphaerales bacterium]|nr:hypothetical protein [Phycisphaerales bacterium]
MSMKPRLFAWPMVVGMTIASMLAPETAQAKLEILDNERMLLTGTINRNDIDQLVEIVTPDVYPKTILVAAWGTGKTAWEAVHEMSKILEKRDITVEMIYAEDAAIALGGRKNVYKGTLIAYNPVDINRNTGISTRVWEWEQTPNGRRSTSRTVTESLTPTVDRFDMACKGRIPKEASDVGNEPFEVAGKNDQFVGRKGVRDETTHVWYYKRTGSRGRWAHNDPTEVRDMIDTARKAMERRLRLIRRTAKSP